MPSILNQSIAIVGGSAGIGLAVARLALKEDTQVAIISSNLTRITTAVDNLKKEFSGSHITGHECNLKAEDVETRLEKTFNEAIGANGGRLFDHIVFTAGEIQAKPLKETNVDFIIEAGRLRFIAPLIVAKLAPRFMKDSFSSSLILTTGVAWRKPPPNWSVPASYLSALDGMTRALAIDIKPIRVNLVCPGATDTELWGASREAIVEEIGKTAFMGRVATADEIAESYIYLMKDTNATGSIVNTDGGYHL
jgi:NAD(P)-dependent dehydrogenase (short-subunit alcohol dehydrogenase family)